MRIISGIYKGKRLTAPKKLPVRPTTDMAKEALFNILAHQYDFEGLKILDLFAGTGNISFEFASRSATQVTAVDKHFACVQYISKTAKELDFEITVVKSDVFKYLQKTRLKADIIFADPPYALSIKEYGKIPQLIFENQFLEGGGMLIVEHPPQISLSDMVNFSEARRYGSSVFSFFNTPSNYEKI